MASNRARVWPEEPLEAKSAGGSVSTAHFRPPPQRRKCFQFVKLYVNSLSVISSTQAHKWLIQFKIITWSAQQVTVALHSGQSARWPLSLTADSERVTSTDPTGGGCNSGRFSHGFIWESFSPNKKKKKIIKRPLGWPNKSTLQFKNGSETLSEEIQQF